MKTIIQQVGLWGIGWLFSLSGYAQTTLQVVSRSIEQHYEGIKGLNIVADRADVEVRAWDKPHIQVQVNLSARHPDGSVARRELESLQFVGERSGKQLFLRNLIVTPASGKLSSSFKTNLVIWLPAACGLTIKQNFGLLRLEGLRANVQASTEFSNMSIHQIQGNVEVKSQYGNLEALRITGKIRVNSEYTKLKVEELRGICSVYAQGGRAQIKVSRQLMKLEVRAQKTDVLVLKEDDTPFNYQLQASHGNLDLPHKLNFIWEQNTPAERKAFLKSKKGGLIDIQTSFATVSLQ